MKKLLACFLLAVMTTTATNAQEDPEYKMEIGAGLGTVAYLGDMNGNALKGMQPWGALIAKYRFNPRSSMGLSVGFGKLESASDHVATWYPIGHYEFSNSLLDAGLRYEYNFWAFGTGREYRGARPLTPYIILGLGMTYVKAQTGVTAMNVPIGAGIKYKVADRLNLAAEWAMHFGGSDAMDGVTDPYGIKSSGIFKNTDCYSVLQVSLTYDVWAKCKTCNNDRY